MAGDTSEAIKLAERAVSEGKAQVIPLAILVDLLWNDGKQDRAKQEFAKLRKVAGVADLETPLLAKLAPVA